MTSQRMSVVRRKEDEDPDHVLSYLTTSQRMSVVRRKERRMRIQTTGSHT